MHTAIDLDEFEETLERAAGLLRGVTTLAALTGAGISAESGVPTFRGTDGLWEGQRVEDVATPFAFERDPALVWRFYHARRANLRAVRPNPGHFALAGLEKRFPDRFTLITQNVDSLHRQAGSRRLLELHGTITRVRCTACQRVEDRGLEELPPLPSCSACGGLARPDIVWFHEALPALIWSQAEQAVLDCQCFLVVGTSAVVYPAAGLIELAREVKAHVIEINITPTAASHLADVGLYGPSGRLLPELLKRLG